MDIDLNLLGPYAPQLQKALASKGNRNTETQQNSVRRANFTALYKKQNIKFIQDQNARRQGRQQKMEEHRKGRRSQIIAEGRKPTIIEMTNELNILIQEDSSNEISELDSGHGDTLSVVLPEKEVSTTSNDISRGDGSEMNQKNTSRNRGHNTATERNHNVINVPNSQIKINGSVNKNASKQDQNRKPVPLAVVKDSRRDQLQKWKKEKEAAELKAKHVQRQPFKVGAPVVTKPVKGISAASLVKSANSTTSSSAVYLGPHKSTLPTTRSNRPATASTTNTKQPIGQSICAPRGINTHAVGISNPTTKPATALPVAKSEDARRVTRAMSKAQISIATSTGSKAIKSANSLGLSKPPIQKMKALDINEKPSVLKPGMAAGKVAVAINKSAKPTSSKTTTTYPPKVISDVKKKGVSTQVALTARKHEENFETNSNPKKEKSPNLAEQKSIPQEQTVKKKKAKPKAIDATYTDYNGRFSDACRKLTEFSTAWRKVLEEQSEIIPEDTRDELYGALGSTKLLLESKLPQFGELLYAYLCKDEDATVILACDLEGWWDVAYIQVKDVCKKFDSLTTLKDNKWNKPHFSPPLLEAKQKESLEQHSAILKSDTGSFLPPQRRVCKPKAQPSTGLKAFLANKRKGIGGNVDNGTNSKATNQGSEHVMNFPFPSVSPATNSVETEDLLPLTSKVNVTQSVKSQEHSHCQDDEQANKLFEGGFFKISSPMATPTTPRERNRERISTRLSNCDSSVIPASAVPVALRTPNRYPRLSNTSSVSEASLRRASMSMLGVRRSMGSFSRIGAAVPVFTKVENHEHDT